MPEETYILESKLAETEEQLLQAIEIIKGLTGLKDCSEYDIIHMAKEFLKQHPDAE